MTTNAHPMQVDHVLVCAQRRCEDLNIDVTFSDRAQTAYTNGQSIVLPAIAQPITVKQLDTLYGQIIHETGHHLRPEAFKILAAAKPPEHLCALYNIVEDDGMERERAEAYRGDAKALSVMNTHLVSELGEAWQEKASLDSDEQDPAPLACLALNQLSRLQWAPVALSIINCLRCPVPLAETYRHLGYTPIAHDAHDHHAEYRQEDADTKSHVTDSASLTPTP